MNGPAGFCPENASPPRLDDAERTGVVLAQPRNRNGRPAEFVIVHLDDPDGPRRPDLDRPLLVAPSRTLDCS